MAGCKLLKPSLVSGGVMEARVQHVAEQRNSSLFAALKLSAPLLYIREVG